MLPSWVWFRGHLQKTNTATAAKNGKWEALRWHRWDCFLQEKRRWFSELVASPRITAL